MLSLRKYLLPNFQEGHVSDIYYILTLGISSPLISYVPLCLQVLVSSCDTIKTQLFLEARSVAQGGVGQINMPLIADADCQLAKKYGVHGGTSDALKNPLRAMFIIDPSGIVK